MTVNVRCDVPLSPLTTLGIGGRAARFARLDRAEQLPDLVAFSRASGLIPLAVGGGSNVLVADTGYDGLVVRVATSGVALRRPDPGGGRVLLVAEAGHPLQDLVDFSVAHGLSGLEFLTGIPGTAGGTPVQNVGAYGQEVADTVAEVEAWDWMLGRRVLLGPQECAFGHRTSLFKNTGRWLILKVTFALTEAALSAPICYSAVADAAGVRLGERAPLEEAAAAVYAVRTKKGMVLDALDPDRRSVGSVFLSPRIDAAQAERLGRRGAPVNRFPDGSTRVSASWLIHEAGYSLGQSIVPGVRISGKHFTIVADDGATAGNFADAAVEVWQRTLEATGIRMTAEPDLIGQLPRYAALTRADNAD